MHQQKRNKGIALDLGYINSIRISNRGVSRSLRDLRKRRMLQNENRIEWLLKAIQCIDLTTLAGDDTPTNVQRLCKKAIQPLRQDILEVINRKKLYTAAVCVYHNLIETAKKELEGTSIPIAAVSTGFPAGQIPLKEKLRQIELSVAAGATEIDVVITRSKALAEDWEGLYEEIRAMRMACGTAHMKTILATGELSTLTNVAKASHVCMMAGADFIKTSTGKEIVNATLPVGLVMLRAIRNYYGQTNYRVGFKPAGGIRTTDDALAWMVLQKEVLGNPWLDKHLFRFGASSLLGAIERELDDLITGQHSVVN